MRKVIVKIDRDKATELERINFELNFVKDIVQRVIESHPNDLELINGGTLSVYNKKGSELQGQYSILAAEIEKEYIPNGSDEMIFDILCNCDIPEIEENA